MDGGVRQICPTRAPAGAWVDPSTVTVPTVLDWY